jgi:hypothetical protein
MGLFEWFGEVRNPQPRGSIEKGGGFPEPPYNNVAWIWGVIATSLVLLLYYKTVFQGIDVFNWPDRLLGFLLVSGYLWISYWVLVKPNYENVGWLGGLIDHPFRIPDDYNRFLIFLRLLLFPGKFLSQGMVVFWKLLQHQNKQQ